MTTNQTLLIVDADQLASIVTKSLQDYFGGSNGQPQANDLMTIAEAASFLKCSIPSLYVKTSKKLIPFHKQGKRIYFSKSELENWVKQA